MGICFASISRQPVSVKASNLHRKAASLVLLLAHVSSCEAASELEPDVQGRYVDLYLGEGVEVCGRQVLMYDRFVEDAYGLYAGSVPDGFRVSLHAVDTAEAIPCGGSAGCALDDGAWFSNMRSAYHEIVHVVHLTEDGRSISALMEGTAQAIGPPFSLVKSPAEVAEIPQELVFSNASLKQAEYDALGVYSRFLIERYGIDRYREFFRAMAEAPSELDAAYRAQFGDVFDESFDDVWTEFSASSRCAYDFWYCAEDRTTEIELPFELTSLDCEDQAATGFDVPGQISIDATFAHERLFAFEHLVDGPVTFELAHVLVDLARCGDCSQQSSTLGFLGLDGDQPTVLEIDLPAGRYSMIVRDQPDGEALLRVYDTE